MRYIVLSEATFFIMAGVLLAGCIQAGVSDPVRNALGERFRLSRIEVQNPRIEGQVFDPGAVLALQADGVPAKRLRMIQQVSKFPRRFHVRDYAPVEIAADGRVTAAPGDFTLSRGTRLVVLDLKTEADRVRLFTHTLEPVRLAKGEAVYGCTEFVFLFAAGTLERGDLFAIQSRIEQWLPPASEKQSAAAL
jgi:hypothetical protein